MRGALSPLAIALLIVGIIVGVAVGYLLAPKGGGGAATVTVTETVTKTATAAAAAKPAGLSGEIPIGLLMPQTGSLAVEGKDEIRAAMMAIEDFNKILEEIGAPFRFKAVVADSGTNPEKALAGLQSLYNKYKVQVVVGPDSSWVLSGVMNYANSHGIVLISPASTSPALALPDLVFRVVGNDRGQGKALAALVKTRGIDAVVVIFRDEAYGRGIAEAFKKNFEELGGTAILLPYNPQKSDFGPEVQKLASEVEKLLSEGKKVGVIIVAFETDGMNILSHAAKIPVLRKVKWFGSEAMRSSVYIKAPDEVRKFLEAVEFEGTFPIPPASPLGKEFIERFKSKYGHEPSSPFAVYAYDAAYIACLTVTLAGKYDGKLIGKLLPLVAAHYYGVSGWKMLDKNGDLKYQDYSIWKYTCEGGTCKFVDIALYKAETGEIIPLKS